MSDYTVVIARLQNEITILKQVAHRAESQVEKASKTGDRDYTQAAALSLQNYYMGVERIFEEIAKRIDQSLPTGANSHQALLEQMKLEIPEIPPAVISPVTAAYLNEYRAFRHVVMHQYGFELYPERVAELVKGLFDCFLQLSRDMNLFCQFLLELDRSL